MCVMSTINSIMSKKKLLNIRLETKQYQSLKLNNILLFYVPHNDDLHVYYFVEEKSVTLNR